MIIVILFVVFVLLLVTINFFDNSDIVPGFIGLFISILLTSWMLVYAKTENKVIKIETREIKHITIDDETFMCYVDKNDIQKISSNIILSPEKYVMVKYYWEPWSCGICGVANESIWEVKEREIVQEEMKELEISK